MQHDAFGWHVQALLEVLRGTIAPKEERLVKYPGINIPEYIANEVYDHVEFINRNSGGDAAFHDAIKQICEITGCHSGSPNDFWNTNALEEHPDWARIKEIARQILVLPHLPPPSNPSP